MTKTLDVIKAPQAVSVRRVLATDLPDDVAAKISLMEAMAEYLKSAREEFDQSLTDYIEENGPVTIGDTRYFVGPVRKPPKCVDVPAAVEAILQTVGGDFQAFCEHLSSNALKYGACSKTLSAELYGQLFVAPEVDELQTEDLTKNRKLQKTDTRFVRPRAAASC